MLRIYGLRTEYRKDPIGIDAMEPRFSWKIESDRAGIIQTHCRVIASSDPDGCEILWDSGMAETPEQQVRWQGPALHSIQRIWWRVSVAVIGRDGGRDVSESEVTFFETGLLHHSDWQAMWITAPEETDPEGRMPAPYFRKKFNAGKSILRARIFQSAHGLYEFRINGKRGTRDVFMPGFTSYYHRIQYQVYDITSLVEEGVNTWTAVLGDGWWRGTTGGAYRNNFGYRLSYIGQIVIDYHDGTREIIPTDTDFLCSTGGLLSSDMKEGDVFDARLEPEKWHGPDYDDSGWSHALPEKDGFERIDTLIASRSVPVTEHETFRPKVLHTPDGNTVLDFGQNIAGYVKMTLHRPDAGQRIVCIHGEALDEEGNFTLKNMVVSRPDARIQQIDYIAAGKETESYCPMFSVFGFRYMLLKGLPGEPDPDDFTAAAVYSDLEMAGTFRCSNPLINQLVSNTLWSQKGNFLDVPTDCPTRERSPWTGDSQIYLRTAADFMNVYPFFEKWLSDLSAEQFQSGKVPNTIPATAAVHNPAELRRLTEKIDALPDGGMTKQIMKMTLGTIEEGGIVDGSAGWGDTAVISPYVLYQCYGDRSILERQYPSARKWVDYMIRQTGKRNEVFRDEPWYDDSEAWPYIWDTGFHFGEWLEPDLKNDNPFAELYARPDYNTATMYCYYSAKLLSEMAGILGHGEECRKYAVYASSVKKAFNKYLIRDDGVIKEGRQAPNVRALAFGLADDTKKEAVAAELARLVRENGFRLNTGFLSTPYLLPVLADYGYTEEAYRILMQRKSPGWLRNVIAGATTIAEEFDGFENCKASFNHYSPGSVCEFLFSYTAGIRPCSDVPGYRCFEVRPVPGGGLREVCAEYECPYGKIISSWVAEEDRITYSITIPAGTQAKLCLPCGSGFPVEERAKYPECTWEANRMNGTFASGTYVFVL